jgi:predicted nuclease of predicted toxin-antitoxin system
VKLKLDENISRHLKPSLAAFGHDVATVEDEQLLSQPDTVVAAAAKVEDSILLTLDIEFGDLRKYPPGSHPGMIVFRPRSFGPLSVNRAVEEFVRSTDLESLASCVVIVEPSRMRVRRPDDSPSSEGSNL